MLKLLVKPTHNCNLSCIYCYDKSFKERTEKMDINDIKKILDMAEKTSDDILWIWHGGEPLIMGIEFYREAMSILRKSKSRIIFFMQTNGTLLTDDFIKEFRDIRIGVSYDGIMHNHNRCNSEEKALKGFHLIKKDNDKAGTIQVVNSDNYKMLSQDYDNNKKKGINCYHMNLVYDSSSKQSIPIENLNEYLKSYKKLFLKWVYDPNPIEVRNFYDKINMLFGKKECMCSSSGNCDKSWFGINPNGDIYPCDRWLPDEYKYGNIKDFESFTEVREKSDKYKTFVKINDERKKYCKENCDIYSLCNGECPANAIVNNGGIRPNKDRCEFIKGEYAIVFNIIFNIDIEYIKNAKLQKILQEFLFRNKEMCYKLEEIVNKKTN